MEDGLFIWLIILAIAVLQGIGSKKKRGKPGQQIPGPPPTRRVPPRPAGETVPGAEEGEEVSPRRGVASASTAQTPGPQDSSEGMIPTDIWEEILGMARGKPPRAEPKGPSPAEVDQVPESGGRPVPEEEAPREIPSRPRTGVREPREERPSEAVARREVRPSPSPRPVPASHTADAALHVSDPSDFRSRLGLSATAPGLEGASQRRLREELFGGTSPKELRKAIVLKEVLGAPLALRDE